MRRLFLAFVGAAVHLAAHAPAAASQEADELGRGPFSWSMSAGVMSDYRARGVSYSDRKPALQAGAAVEHGSGLYAFADAATVRFGADRDIEVSVGAGWATDLGDTVELDLSAMYVGYADFLMSDYVEATAAARVPIGSVTPFVGLDFAPAQTPIRGQAERLASNLYVHGGAEWAIKGTPLTLSAELGRERGSFVPDGGTKWDWQLGAAASVRGFELGLAYVDSDYSRSDPLFGRLTGSALVATASTSF